jgi:hypothetical protein
VQGPTRVAGDAGEVRDRIGVRRSCIARNCCDKMLSLYYRSVRMFKEVVDSISYDTMKIIEVTV